MTPERFCAGLKRLWGGNLKSVVLYGSAASGGYNRRYSDFNLLLVVGDSSRTYDWRSSRLFRAWTAAGNPAPLVMTRDFMLSSADVFPVEWDDIRERRRVLLGPDPVRGLRVSGRNTRLELERELKANFLRLQGRLRSAEGRPGEERELMVLSASTFLTLFRACLRLIGVRPLPAKRDAARGLSRRLRFDAAAFDFIGRLRSGDREAGKADLRPWMGRYLRTIEKVINSIDRIGIKEARRT